MIRLISGEGITNERNGGILFWEFNDHLKLKIMMTIFIRDYSHRLRHSSKKQDNNAVKTKTIGNTPEVA